jgi:glycosyltransferase involved in cell wall biosynthesis
LEDISNLTWTTHPIPHRQNGLVRLAANRTIGLAARTAVALSQRVSNAALNPGLLGFERLLGNANADIYMAHNIDTLLPAWKVARRKNALLMFDSMEFHSDMGDGQSPRERKLIQHIERKCLQDCVLVLASSPEMADLLQQEYDLEGVIPVYNTPAVVTDLAEKEPGFNLYWRNAVLNVGQRGLGDILQAMTELPADIRLHLQGRLPFDGGLRLRETIAQLRLTDRVIFHPPYLPESAVYEASRYQVGLCLEQRCNRNHDVTVSNKMFDYHMAGLAVISSDMPGLKPVIERSGGGLTYEAGAVDQLREAVVTLYNDPQLLQQKSASARRYALAEGNLRTEMQAFTRAFADRIADRWSEYAEQLMAVAEPTPDTMPLPRIATTI